MNSSPKIFVFKMREIIYTLLLLGLVVLLIVCLVLMFGRQDSDTAAPPGETGITADTGQTGNTADTGTNRSTADNDMDNSNTDRRSSESGAAASESGTAASESGTTASASGTAVSDSGAIYTAGVYTTPVNLGTSTVDVEVTVDQNHINAIRLVNLNETTAASFPLVSPSLDHIASQILETQKLDGITCAQENRYTSQLLLSAISEALDRARP